MSPEQALNHRKKQEAVARLGQIGACEFNLDTLFQETTAVLATTLGAELCKVLELLPNGENFCCVQALAGKWLRWTAKVNADSTTQAGYTLHSNEQVIVADVSSETALSPAARRCCTSITWSAASVW